MQEEEPAEASMEVQDVQTYEKIFMTDWLEDNQVIALKENEVIGTAYAGGLFRADIRGEVHLVEGITEEMIYLIEKMDNTIFYNTSNNPSLIAHNLGTQESASLPFNDVRDMIASPSENQLIYTSYDGENTNSSIVMFAE